MVAQVIGVRLLGTRLACSKLRRSRCLPMYFASPCEKLACSHVPHSRARSKNATRSRADVRLPFAFGGCVSLAGRAAAASMKSVPEECAISAKPAASGKSRHCHYIGLARSFRQYITACIAPAKKFAVSERCRWGEKQTKSKKPRSNKTQLWTQYKKDLRKITINSQLQTLCHNAQILLEKLAN